MCTVIGLDNNISIVLEGLGKAASNLKGRSFKRRRLLPALLGGGGLQPLLRGLQCLLGK